MEAQYEEISQWKSWSLEDTLALLQKKFPGSAIWVVRPTRMLRYLFSCFHNFVQSSIVGIPTYSSGYGAVPHIECLLQDAIQQAYGRGQLRIPPRVVFELPLVLIGFSKGCVVLNQIVHELVNFVVLDHTHLSVPYHHTSSSSLHHYRHRKTPSVSSVSSLSSMEDGPTHKPSLSNPQSPIVKKKMGGSNSSSSTASQSHSNTSIHRHPSISSLSSETGAGGEKEHHHQHRSRSRSPMVFSRSGSSSSASQGRRVVPLTEEDVMRLRQLLGRLKAMYWLDAGHSGGCGAWVTDDELLRCLASLNTEVHVHVTPQQVCDPNRVWIREEEREFVDKLRYYGASVSELIHFEQEERSLENHFRVLNNF